jgi:hypothetical protein
LTRTDLVRKFSSLLANPHQCPNGHSIGEWDAKVDLHPRLVDRRPRLSSITVMIIYMPCFCVDRINTTSKDPDREALPLVPPRDDREPAEAREATS